MKNLWIYIKSVLFPVIVGGIVGVIISGFIDYKTLQKPPLSPPGTIFPIMWTILYFLMGVSYARLKIKDAVDSSIKYSYYLQLFVNAMWSIFFFVLKWRFFSFIWILLLIVLVIVMIIKFYSKDKISGILQIPYLLWILFASYLNLGIYFLNR